MIAIQRHSGVYTLKACQKIPWDLEKAWDFLSDPANLNRITPPKMRFEITSPKLSGTVYPGMIITYRVSPFPGIRTNWVTEITHVKAGEYFVDEQRFGPYRMWHHEHLLRPASEGVEMEDIVTYKVPGGWIGRLFHQLFIRKQLMGIFSYREKALEKIL